MSRNLPMDRNLTVGVVGAGVFAGYHANKVKAHKRATLSGIFDLNDTKARSLADRLSVPTAPTLSNLINGADALIVASPASAHKAACEAALRAGLHVLVEKPLATTVEDAEQIVNAAKGADRVIQVGHQERIVAEAIGLQNLSARPHSIEIIRHTAKSTRNLDTSIVMDMMIHDLDLVLSLYGPPINVEVLTSDRIYSNHLDVAKVRLIYSDMTVQLSASRDSKPDRRWQMTFDRGSVHIDFGQKTIAQAVGFNLDAGFGTRPDVQDNLAAAFDRFVKACLDGDPPLASGDDGLAAVKVAAQIESLS